MAIPFSNVPSNLRTPLFFAEVDNSHANTASEVQRTLIIGQMLDTGIAKPNIPVICSSVAQARELGGSGSMLHLMANGYFQNDKAGNVYLLPLADGEVTLARGSVEITTAPSETGIISLYIGGERVQLKVLATDTVDSIASALAAAINKKTELPVTASVVDSTVEIIAKNGGELGNSIDIRLNYAGSAGGEQTPQGLELKTTKMAGGLGAPELSEALMNLQDKKFDFIVQPYTDVSSMNEVKGFLDDITGRWSYSKQIYGHALSVFFGTYGEITAKGESRNYQHESIVGVFDSPSPAYVWAACMFGASATSLRNDPGRPLQSLAVKGVKAPPLESQFDLTERNNLLHSGISTYTVDDDGTVRINNIITTYQKNAYGAADDSYLEIETLFLLMFILRDLNTLVTSKFGRMKLAADGTRFAPGSAIVTPKIIHAELVARYKWLEWNGYVQDSKGFAKNLIVEQNRQNPNRVDVLYPGVLINQLRVLALLNQFRLQAES